MPRQPSVSHPARKPGGAAHPAGGLRGVALWAAATAVVGQAAIRNLLWTCIILGAPVTTVGFIYQVVVMQQERLRHEFVANAAEALSRDLAEPDLIDVKLTAPSLADARPNGDLHQTLFATLIARARFVDMHGIDPKTMTVAARKVAMHFLEEDAEMFRRLQAEKQKNRDIYLFDWRADEGRLRILHAELDALVSQPLGAAKPR